MSARNYGVGPMPTASDITIDTPVRLTISGCVCVLVVVVCVCRARAPAQRPHLVAQLPDGMSILYDEVAEEQAAARSAWETQQYSMDQLWGLPSISDDVLPDRAQPEIKKEKTAPKARAPASAPSIAAVGIKPGSADVKTDPSMPPPPGVPDTRPAHVIDPTWGRVGRSYSQSKPKVPRTGRSSGDKDRHSGGKAGKKEKKKRVVRKRNFTVPQVLSPASLLHTNVSLVVHDAGGKRPQ